jgi:hypothetical protein
LVHVASDDEGIGGLPRLRFVVEERELEREIVLVLRDEGVDAAGVGFEQRACVVVHGGDFAVGNASEAESAEVFVGFAGEGAEDFGELAAGSATKKVELEEAVLSHDVALGLGGVFERRGADVRDAPVVAINGDRLVEAREGKRAVESWKRSVDEIPGSESDDDYEDGENPD